MNSWGSIDSFIHFVFCVRMPDTPLLLGEGNFKARWLVNSP